MPSDAAFSELTAPNARATVNVPRRCASSCNNSMSVFHVRAACEKLSDRPTDPLYGVVDTGDIARFATSTSRRQLSEVEIAVAAPTFRGRGRGRGANFPRSRSRRRTFRGRGRGRGANFPRSRSRCQLSEVAVAAPTFRGRGRGRGANFPRSRSRRQLSEVVVAAPIFRGRGCGANFPRSRSRSRRQLSEVVVAAPIFRGRGCGANFPRSRSRRQLSEVEVTVAAPTFRVRGCGCGTNFPRSRCQLSEVAVAASTFRGRGRGAHFPRSRCQTFRSARRQLSEVTAPTFRGSRSRLCTNFPRSRSRLRRQLSEVTAQLSDVVVAVAAPTFRGRGRGCGANFPRSRRQLSDVVVEVAAPTFRGRCIEISRPAADIPRGETTVCGLLAQFLRPRCVCHKKMSCVRPTCAAADDADFQNSPRCHAASGTELLECGQPHGPLASTVADVLCEGEEGAARSAISTSRSSPRLSARVNARRRLRLREKLSDRPINRLMRRGVVNNDDSPKLVARHAGNVSERPSTSASSCGISRPSAHVHCATSPDRPRNATDNITVRDWSRRHRTGDGERP